MSRLTTPASLTGARENTRAIPGRTQSSHEHDAQPRNDDRHTDSDGAGHLAIGRLRMCAPRLDPIDPTRSADRGADERDRRAPCLRHRELSPQPRRRALTDFRRSTRRAQRCGLHSPGELPAERASTCPL